MPATTPLSGSVVIPLSRQGPRRSAATEASFYVGALEVGYPAKTLRVVFDTASGHVILPHRACQDLACLERRRYSPWESAGAVDINEDNRAVQAGARLASGNASRDGVDLSYSQSDLGEGNIAAMYVRDTVCVGAGAASGQACVKMGLLAATKMDEEPFRHMPGDGIVGLGLSSLAVGPFFSFFRRLLEDAANVVPQFGLALGAERGELHLGGHDLSRLAAPLRWFPVDHPQAGFWQVAIQRILVGDRVVDDCSGGCHGIVDSGVSRLGVQTSRMPPMQSALTSALVQQTVCTGPNLTFDLGSMALTLAAEDYADSSCAPLLGPLELPEPQFVGVYAFGVTLLRRYYAAFDWDEMKLGFAPLASDPGRASERSETIPDALVGMLQV